MLQWADEGIVEHHYVCQKENYLSFYNVKSRGKQFSLVTLSESVRGKT